MQMDTSDEWYPSALSTGTWLSTGAVKYLISDIDSGIECILSSLWMTLSCVVQLTPLREWDAIQRDLGRLRVSPGEPHGVQQSQVQCFARGSQHPLL